MGPICSDPIISSNHTIPRGSEKGAEDGDGDSEAEPETGKQESKLQAQRRRKDNYSSSSNSSKGAAANKIGGGHLCIVLGSV
ncbi:hypothetical protein M5D96_006020 [Drosophila gunungcola]|uniref:Uncharacterized protein n=1 Tax=Drosophila gunungcola TaxID=103775 RepID=A0A9Q0BRQ9_9MUSC|nr:hypothetical protein M5D96_006020 [Drosophila gunungcola]